MPDTKPLKYLTLFQILNVTVDEWKSQIRRGSMELCVLALIQSAPRYGYELISSLEGWPILSAKESTIYPLLRRLMKEGFLTSFWQETAEGLPPRKYYSITPAGQDYLAAMWAEWDNLVAAMAAVKGE